MTDGIRLASRYSFMPNKLRYSEGSDADSIIFEYCCGKKENFGVVKVLLERLGAVNLFLNLIAEKNGLSKFNSSVVEAYWIGNRLLENVSGNDIRKAIKGFAKPSLAKELLMMVPDNALPHHSFHVFHINSVAKSSIYFANLDNCRISPASVRQVGDSFLTVSYRPIVKSGKIGLQHEVDKKVIYNKGMLKPRQGDFVAVHWGMAVDKLSRKQAENLENYTIRNIDAMNSLL